MVVAFLVGLGAGILVAPYFFFAMHPFPSGGGNFSRVSSGQLIGTQFSSSRYAASSYLISGNATLSSSGQIATGDFNLTEKPIANGSVEYSIKFDESGTVYNVTVGSGDRLYYIDSNLADDMKGADLSLGDDGYAVVNATGYVVAFKYPLPNS